MYSGVGIFSVYLVAHKANSVSSAYSSGILLLGLVGKLSFPPSKFWLHALLTAVTISGTTQGGAKREMSLQLKRLRKQISNRNRLVRSPLCHALVFLVSCAGKEVFY